MSLMIVGTMAFDALETPFGKVDRIIGVRPKSEIARRIERAIA